MAAMQKQPLSLFSLNCYLVPSLFSFKKVNSTCREQGSRSGLIADLVIKKKPDVILFQEMWGTNVNQIHHKLAPQYHLQPSTGSWGGVTPSLWNLYGYKTTILDPLLFWLNHSGGLMSGFDRNKFHLKDWKKHTFTVSESGSRKGVSCLHLDTSSLWGEGSSVMLFNTHLDPNHRDNKREQISQIHSFVKQSQIQILNLRKSSIEKAEQGGTQVSKCGVLIVGDFNIPSSWKEERQLLLDRLNARDLYSEHITQCSLEEDFTYESDNSYFTKLVETKTSRRIDYVLAVDSVDDKKMLPLSVHGWDIEKQERGREVSDHWAQIIQVMPQE
ncbi:hypothetical protein PROFUN_01939 [Planoprotostelium fungivorum]|uniref:Endonuclease/exonuclease/phosphatase domain-containing protein n=1 Tax=Planoprotostelium fungivorum TaxID=1890364 RepID=A0A2P6NAX4_9EUKA|nr:hypothetical protein PROFUN_01939 [Planoprotostelium fungivorum]